MEGHTGTALLALRSGAPVVPVGIWGSEHLRGGWRAILSKKPVRMSAGEPFVLQRGARIRRQDVARAHERLMAEIAAQLPEAYRGVYAGLDLEATRRSGSPEAGRRGDTRMKIHRARDMGFCFGVRRAVDMMQEAAAEGRLVTTLGQVVHNPQVVRQLEDTGIAVNESRTVDGVSTSTVAITAHGVGETVVRDIEAQGFDVIDTTCQFVARSQRAARNLAERGFAVIIFGDPTHPEVKGVLGWCRGRGMIIPNESLEGLPDYLAEQDRRDFTDDAHAGALRGVRGESDGEADRPADRDSRGQCALQRDDFTAGGDSGAVRGSRPDDRGSAATTALTRGTSPRCRARTASRRITLRRLRSCRTNGSAATRMSA